MPCNAQERLADPFQRGHEAQFSLFVTQHNDTTSAACAVTCQFCLKFGKEAKPGAKRKRSSHGQSCTTFFRCDVYKRYRETAHSERRAEFQQLTTAEMSSYFDQGVNHTNTLFAHFGSHCTTTLTFNRDVVEKVIGNLQFNVDDESVQLTRICALSVFKMHEDAIPEDMVEVYLVKIESVLRFKIVLGFFSKGASFQSASRFINLAWEATNISYMQGCSEGVFATYV